MSYTLKNKLLHGRGDNIYNYINSYIDQHKKEKDIKRQIINSEFLKCCEKHYQQSQPRDMGIDYIGLLLAGIIEERFGVRYRRFRGFEKWIRNYNKKPIKYLEDLIDINVQMKYIENSFYENFSNQLTIQ